VGVGRALAFDGEEQLVDDDAVRVDLVRRELLDEALRLVERQELADADADLGDASI
jgi:hypothetical protein